MRIKLFSGGHLSSARILFTNKIDDENWLNKKWTDDEINKCKYYETKDFIKNPSFKEYKSFLSNLTLDEFCKDDLIFDWYLKELGEIDCDNLNILSIGCGQGQRELLLADKFNINITAIDNAPYTNELNFVAKELGLSDKVKFTNMSGKKLSFGDESFDIIISHAVVYCIDDEELNNFYSEKFRVLKNNGLVFMSTGSNISIFSKIKIYLKKILKKMINPVIIINKLVGNVM